MCCLGRCHENSSFHYAGKNYSGTAIQQIADIKAQQLAVKDHYEVRALGTPVLTAPFPGVDEYYTILKEALSHTPDELLAELKTSGLRGRGGAGFPIAFKLESCKNTADDQKYIVCNADEGDPGAYSDRYLLEERPHSVLLGMMIAGYITG
ncbi:MAG: formate dehydrogenase, partial [Chitinophagia bacterium]|nr:formate dehydrogenase [Chitinophagia bacterium]